MLLRLLLAVALLGAVFLVTAALAAARRRERAPDSQSPLPPLPPELVAGDTTWIVFTTEYCAACEPVKERITRLDPDARIVEVDVGRRPDLARRYRVRTAPTVLHASANGRVVTRVCTSVGA